MTGLPFVKDDGGRADAGYKGSAGDCVTRAIAIAGQLPYQQVYDELHELIRTQRRKAARSRSPRNGVPRTVIRRYFDAHGWTWTPTMGIGTGCTVHVTPGELPDNGRHVLNLSGHLAALTDGTVRDTHDPSRNGTRCVYGYWTAP